MKSKLIRVVVLGLVGVAVYAGNVAATPSAGLTTTILLKASIGPSDLYVVDNKLVPGGTTGWHSHPGPSLIMVVKGTVTNYEGDDPSCTPRTFTAGQSFTDPGNGHVHTLRNEGTASAETIAVQVLPKDAPRRIDKPAPGNCGF